MLDEILQFLSTWPWPIPALVVGVIGLLAGGHLLVTGSVALAKRFSVSPLLVGLTIVAFGTSAPELAFNIIAALNGRSGLSFGNIVGSNIANLALVVGASAMIAPLAVQLRIIRLELPILILISLIMLGMAFLVPQLPDGVTRGYARLEGVIFLVGFVAFMLLMIQVGRKDRAAVLDPDIAKALEDVDELSPPPLLGVAVGLFIGGLVLLVGGGKLAEIGAIGLAEKAGLSDAVIGLTVVALATSLPEVVTSIIAAMRGEADLAIGNVIGSNLFNILLVFGITSVISPVALPDAGLIDLLVMNGVTILLGILILIGRSRIGRPAGLMLLAIYVGYMIYTVAREKVGG